MKRNIIKFALVIFTVASINTGCKNEEDDLFDKSAAQRMNEYVATYTDNLISAKNGWVMEYFLPENPGNLICAKFNRDQSVVASSFLPDNPDKLCQETSVWEVIADKGPVLSFITYNQCIHFYADPQKEPEGRGYEGDYEFSIINCDKNAESTLLKGKKNQIYVNLLKLPEGVSQEEYLNDIRAFRNSIMSEDAPNENMLTVDDSLFYIQDIASGSPNFYRANGDAVADESYFDYLITKHLDGNYYLRFRDAIVMCVTNEMKDFVDANNEVVSRMVKSGFLIEEKNVTPEIKEKSVYISKPMQLFKYNDHKFVSTENPKASIYGNNVSTYFPTLMQNENVTFVADTTCMSEAYNSVIRNLYAEICSKATGYDIAGLTLKKRGDNVTLEINMYVTNRGRKTQSAWSYKFAAELNNGVFSLKYVEPLTTSDANKLTLFPSTLTLLEMLSDSYSYDFDKTFDVSGIKCISKTKPNNSIVFKQK